MGKPAIGREDWRYMKEHYKAILFDLDGTLLPMDMEKFTHGYFKELYKKVAHLGIEAPDFVDAIWKGTYAMMKNDGAKKNIDRFWDTFVSLTGIERAVIEPICDGFYLHEFVDAKCYTIDNPYAKEAVRLAHEKADTVILSTNPIFPMDGQKTRLSWIDLTVDDFELVTSYENENFCKPNPMYFLSILERFDLKPEECLVIGNDEREDGYCATKAKIDCYLVTDTMIENKEYPFEGPKGTFKEMLNMLNKLN